MNKQFLSLLLLTSFVGTMSAAAPLFITAGEVTAPLLLTAGSTAIKTGFFSKAAGFMSAAGSKFAGLTPTSQYALASIPLMGAGVATGTVLTNGISVSEKGAQVLSDLGGAFGKSQYGSIRNAVSAAELAARPWYKKVGDAIAGYTSTAKTATVATSGVVVAGSSEKGARMLSDLGGVFGKSQYGSIFEARNAAELAARPWYTKAGSAVAGYASTAKTATVAGTTAAFEFAKANKGKTAGIVVGTVAAGYLVYKGYNKLFSSNSISLNEQEKASLKTALVKADELGKHVFHNPSVTSPVRLEEVFTTESTGLPKKAVDVLNKHVAIRRKLSDIAEVQRTNTLSSTDLAIQQELKALDAQVMGMLSPVVAA